MRKIPDDNLAYPVLVSVGPSTGSGFYLNTGISTLLITAYHVLYDPQTHALRSTHAELTSYGADRSNTNKNYLQLDLAAMASLGDIKTDPAADIAVIRVFIRNGATNTITTTPGITSATFSGSPIVGVPMEAVSLHADVMIANEVCILGYPVSLGLPDLPQLDYSRPLLRTGIVAGKNDSLRSIVLDCPVYPGNSGGLVLQIEDEGLSCKYRVIGVVIQFVPTIAEIIGTKTSAAVVNSGYSIAASMDNVLALAQQF